MSPRKVMVIGAAVLLAAFLAGAAAVFIVDHELHAGEDWSAD